MPKFDIKKVKTVPLKSRKSKVHLKDFSTVFPSTVSLRKFYQSLPNVLAAKNLLSLAKAINQAKKKKKLVLVMMGAHVIKCGLSPLIIDLIKKGFINALALNGAGIIHDFELAFCGHTSEDVACGLEDGSFGMARETGVYLNGAIIDGAKKNIGLGRSVGQMMAKENLPHKDLSILYSGIKYKIPVTVHVALGTDIIHQHPNCDGAAVGKTSLNDFRILAEQITNLNNGGVVINIGSAVILPEVFLKCLTVARNLGFTVKDFTSANFDMIHQYRPQQNVTSRPILCGGVGYNFTGHHEIMVPLLYGAILNE